MGFIFGVGIWLLCIYFMEKGIADGEARDKKSRLARQRWEKAKQPRMATRCSDDDARRVPSGEVHFRNPDEKAAAFEKLITWAKQEAKSQGLSFDEVHGENDYRKAKQVFMNSQEWKQLRLSTIERDKKCLRCGATDDLQGDHVIPMVRRPDRFNEAANLQTLCGPCNNWKMVKAIDYRRVEKTPPKPKRYESKIVAIRDGIPVTSRFGEAPTETQKEIWAALSLSPEELRQHKKRVTQELQAERLAAQEARRAAKRDGRKPKPKPKPNRKVMSLKERKRREQAIKDRRNLETWRRANEQPVIDEVRLRSPMRKHGRFDWYLCERAFREAEYQQEQSGHVRFSYLGWNKKSTKQQYSCQSEAPEAHHRARKL